MQSPFVLLRWASIIELSPSICFIKLERFSFSLTERVRFGATWPLKYLRWAAYSVNWKLLWRHMENTRPRAKRLPFIQWNVSAKHHLTQWFQADAFHKRSIKSNRFPETCLDRRNISAQNENSIVCSSSRRPNAVTSSHSSRQCQELNYNF